MDELSRFADLDAAIDMLLVCSLIQSAGLAAILMITRSLERLCERLQGLDGHQHDRDFEDPRS
jgi:hypothetical protein